MCVCQCVWPSGRIHVRVCAHVHVCAGLAVRGLLHRAAVVVCSFCCLRTKEGQSKAGKDLLSVIVVDGGGGGE